MKFRDGFHLKLGIESRVLQTHLRAICGEETLARSHEIHSEENASLDA